MRKSFKIFYRIYRYLLKENYRIIEITGLTLVLAGLAFYFLKTSTLMPYSDPAKWYIFGKNFFTEFGHRRLVCNFPLLIAVAIKVAGPYNAFIINLPILLILLLCIYMFSSQHIKRNNINGETWSGLLCGAFAILIFIIIDKQMMSVLVNPYRDPLAFILSLVACMSLVNIFYKTNHTLLFSGISGFFIGLACGTRETLILLLIPMFLFSLSFKLRKHNFVFRKPLGVFVVMFIIACGPALYQNALVSDNPFVPVQGARKATEYKNKKTDGHTVNPEKIIIDKIESVIPGISHKHWKKTCPQTMTFLLHHYGFLLGLLYIGGLIIAVKQRNFIVLFLSFPAALIYFLFYANYVKVVERYLFVIDLFVVPVIAYAMTFISGICMRWLRNRRFVVTGYVSLSIMAFILSFIIAIYGAGNDRERYFINHARNFHNKIKDLLPENAFIIAERPLEGFFGAFSSIKSKPVIYLGKVKQLRDPLIPDKITGLIKEKKTLYFAYYTDKYENFIRREFDITPVADLSAEDYGFSGKFGNNNVRICRIYPWSVTSNVVRVRIDSPGLHTLTLDTGHLSRYKRNYVRIFYDGNIIDKNPSDYLNYYPIFIKKTGNSIVCMKSDNLLSKNIVAEILNISDPVKLSFIDDSIIQNRHRLSSSFYTNSKLRYPFLEDEGIVTVPTLSPQRCIFAFVCEVGLAMNGRRTLSISTDDKLLFSGNIFRDWQNIAFIADSKVISNDETRLVFRMDNDRKPVMLLKSVVVQRIKLGDSFNWLANKSGYDGFTYGLYVLEQTSGGAFWRWTGEKTEILIPIARKDLSLSVNVGYFDENRPSTVKYSKPVFRVNGVQYKAEYTQKVLYGLKYIEAKFIVDPEALSDIINTLEIQMSPWIPSEHGMGDDSRKLGIMLHSITANIIQ